MKGLILKDIYMIQKYCRSFVLSVALFFIVSCFSKDNTFFLTYPILISGMIPVTLIAYDEREKWHIYSETMPCTRAQFVSSKFITGLIFELAVFILSVAVQAYRMSDMGEFSLVALLTFAGIILSIGFISPALLLPFVFRFGAEKGRITNYIVIGALCADGTILSQSSLSLPTWLCSDRIMLFVMLVVITLYICSWPIRIAIQRERALIEAC